MAQRREDSELTNLRRLALFLQIAEAESFSHASVQTGVSQPVLSRYVGALEREVGARVFYRDGRGVRLTDAGVRLQKRVKNIMAELAAARLELAENKEGSSGKAVLGVQPAVGSLLTVPIASRALRELPNVSLHIMEGLSAHILEWLHAGRIDIALHYDQPNVSRTNSDSILEQDLMLVGPKDAGLKLEGTVPASRLGELPLILPGKPHGLRLILEAHALRNGFTLNVPLEIDSAPSIVGLVAGGLGHSVLPLNSILEACRAGHVSASWIAKPRITRTLMMTIATHRPLTPTARRIIQIIRQEARQVSAAAQQVRVAKRRTSRSDT